MAKALTALLLLVFLLTSYVRAQDTLPRFTVVEKPNNRNVISWTNTFRYISQISIQRSGDSLRNFKTILTVPDPSVAQNGFVDTKAPASEKFYRLFIVLDSGKYQFSRSKRPALDTAAEVSAEPLLKNDNQRVVLSDSLSNREVTVLEEKLKPKTTVAPRAEKFFVVKKNNVILQSVAQRNVQRFRDSIVFSTRDTMVFAAVDTILIKPFVVKEVYRASRFVFTERFGNVMISLPGAETKKYSISFFEEDKSPLFELKEVRSSSLILDKVNFIHSGWFWFELYENGSLKERHKFFIPKDF